MLISSILIYTIALQIFCLKNWYLFEEMDDNSSARNGGRFFCAFTGVKEVNLPATSCLKKINEKSQSNHWFNNYF